MDLQRSGNLTINKLAHTGATARDADTMTTRSCETQLARVKKQHRRLASMRDVCKYLKEPSMLPPA
eukprot:11883699-Karenia_brevis.AAC.1